MLYFITCNVIIIYIFFHAENIEACHEVSFCCDAQAFLAAIQGRQKRGLAVGWSDIISDAFRKVWPYCSLTIIRNYISTSPARKITGPYCLASTCCKTKGCVSVEICCKPQANSTTVTVNATVTGICRHIKTDTTDDSDVPNRRQLCGKKRRDVVDEVVLSGQIPTDVYC